MASCGNNDRQKEWRSYRIRIGMQDCSFEQQLLYLTIALELYRLHVGAYPNMSNSLEALIGKPEVLEATGTWRGPYVESDSLFLDPWKRRLQYKLNEEGKAELSSLGSDGQPGYDDILAKDLFPDFFRELDKLPTLGRIPIPSATGASN